MDAIISRIKDAIETKTWDKHLDVAFAMKKYQGNEELQREALHMLMLFAYNDAERQKEIARLGGIEAIVRAMRAHRSIVGIQDYACGALANLANNAENQKRIVKEGGIDAVLRAMESHKASEGVQAQGCGALSNIAMATNGTENAERIAKEDGIAVVLRAMETHKTIESVQLYGVVALQKIGCTAELLKRIGTEGGVEAILRAMESQEKSEGIQQFGCTALYNLALDAENQKRIAKKGGIAAVLRAMESHKKSEGVQLQGCMALACLAENNAENKKLIAKEGGATALVRAMESHKTSEAVQKYGNMALEGICENFECVAKAGDIATILGTMSLLPKSSSVQAGACDVLYTLVSDSSENQARITKEGGIDAVHRALRNFPSDSHVQENGKRALGALLYNPSAATKTSVSAGSAAPVATVKGEMMVTRRTSPGGSTKTESLRLATSQFKQLYTAINATWKSSDYWNVSDGKVKRRVRNLVKDFLGAYCKSKSIPPKSYKEFVSSLFDEVDDNLTTAHGHSTAEAMAVLLWTSAETLRVGKSNFELCTILNEIIRTDGGSAAFGGAIHLVCMIQHFLNAGRRGGKFNIKPLGPTAPHGMGWSTKRNTVFRGGSIPTVHLAFFRSLAGKDQYFRIAHLLATSFDESTAYKFAHRSGCPKVLWIFELDATFGCVHVNLIDNSITAVKNESEYLFSAYSAFKVVKVEESSTPENWTTPHKITLKAAPDNSLIDENVPTAPWC
eukprot:g1689.t1